MCKNCKWNQLIHDSEYGDHKECCCPDDEPCPLEKKEDIETTEHVGDSAYDRAIAFGMHPTEIPESWKHI